LTQVLNINPGSPADGHVQVGEALVAINGNPIGDVLDYRFYSYDKDLLLTLRDETDGWKLTFVHKEEGEDLGLTFQNALMDTPRACANRCIFCFMDQLPQGMRSTLYFKDDDVRLSLLTGNYVSLTNVTEAELERIIRLRMSPINISVHATDPDVRTRMLGNPNAGQCMELLRRLQDADITMNAQIVLCPGINDGAILSRTMADLSTLQPQLQSVSIVPVGLTRHRAGRYPLTPVDPALARVTIRQVEECAACCLHEYGTRLFFLADEFYLLADRPLPEEADYEGYPQLENGVGLMRSFRTEFLDALAEVQRPQADMASCKISIATGALAAPFLQDLLATASEKCGTLDVTVHSIRNDFFGESITVAGLVTGEDILAQLMDQPLGSKLLIPQSMLRRGEDVFLDNMTVDDLSAKLGVPVVPVEVDGYAFLEALLT